MTILAPSLIAPATSKLLSYLSFKSGHSSEFKPHGQSSDITTYISIVMKKDGTPTTKYITPPPLPGRLLSRRRRSSCSSQCPASSPPKQRKLMISSLLPRLYNLSRRSSRQDINGLVKDHHSTEQSRSQKVKGLCRLPLELTLQIILNLDCSSLLKLSRTNKYFYQLCHHQHDYVWQNLFRADYVNSIPTADTRYFHYYDLYKNHFELKKRWKYGRVKTKYLTGHHDSVYCLVWIGNDRILSGSRDQSIKLWDLESNKTLLTKTHHDGSVLCLRVSDDQTFFVSGSSDTTCLIWSLPNFIPQKRLLGHTSGVLDICIVKNKYIVSSSRDATIRVWDKDTGDELRQLVGHGGPVNALGAFGNQVVSASGDTTLKLWDIETGECLKTFAGHTRGLACVRFDGKYIFSGGQDNKLKVWDVETGQCLSTLPGHSDLIRTIDSFENVIVSGSYDRTLRVWDRKENKCLLSFHSGHSSWIFNCLLNRTKIISAGQDKRIMVLDFGYDLKTIDSY